MSTLAPLHELGVTVQVTDDGKLRLQCDREIPEAVEYARRNKQAIVAELTRDAGKRGRPPLPDACPLVNGGYCPPECRFETRLMVRLIETGALPDPKIGCPLRHVCGLFSEWPRTRPEYPIVEDDPLPPEHEPQKTPPYRKRFYR